MFIRLCVSFHLVYLLVLLLVLKYVLNILWFFLFREVSVITHVEIFTEYVVAFLFCLGKCPFSSSAVLEVMTDAVNRAIQTAATSTQTVPAYIPNADLKTVHAGVSDSKNIPMKLTNETRVIDDFCQKTGE